MTNRKQMTTSVLEHFETTSTLFFLLAIGLLIGSLVTFASIQSNSTDKTNKYVTGFCLLAGAILVGVLAVYFKHRHKK